jgi:hypothetical protein
MPTLVLSQRYSTDSSSLWRAALAAGWDVERVRGFAVEPGLAGRDPVVYGETLFADAVMDPLGVAMLEPTEDWLPCLPERYRLRDVRLSTLGEACSLAAPAFVKAPDEKWLPARVYSRGVAIEADPGLSRDMPVLVAEPVVFEVEFRLFVMDRAVCTASVYVRGGEIASVDGEWPADPREEEEALAFAGSLLRDPEVALPAAVVVDVGRILGRGWAVVEANPAWASGLCGTDPRAVLPVIRRATVPRARLSAQDERWVRGGAKARAESV